MELTNDITAMILCAGFGTRLGELTKNTPKPMLLVKGKPILEHTILHLKNHGVKKFIINLHYLPEKITDYFGDGSRLGVEIQYSYEDEPLGTAGAVKKVEKMFTRSSRRTLCHLEENEVRRGDLEGTPQDDGEREIALRNDNNNFLVLYGDIFCDQNYTDFIKFHLEKNSLASIVLHEREKSNSIVEMNSDNKITKFLERPPEREFQHKTQNWVNSGLYIFKREILDYIPNGTFCDFPKDIFGKLVKENKLYGFSLTGYRCAVDSKERYETLCNKQSTTT